MLDESYGGPTDSKKLVYKIIQYNFKRWQSDYLSDYLQIGQKLNGLSFLVKIGALVLKTITYYPFNDFVMKEIYFPVRTEKFEQLW